MQGHAIESQTIERTFWLQDLRWLLLSSPLLNNQHPHFANKLVEFGSQEQEQIETWLARFDDDAQSQEVLHNWMHSKPAKSIIRLGRYAEHLLEFYLRNGPTHTLELANLQLQSDSKTIGEIDYLVRTQNQVREHWELAVKFFMCPDLSASDRVPHARELFGPDRADNLAAKISKLIDRQINQQPPAPWSEFEWAGKAFTRGWIFYANRSSLPSLPELCSHHGKGIWQSIDQLRQLDSDLQFLLLPRQRWLAPFTVPRQFIQTANIEVCNAQTIALRVESLWQSRTPTAKWPAGVLVAQVRSGACARGETLCEVERIMVMPKTAV